ncbi:MAG: helix-turn-helix domain-containing protein [Blautia hansenii]
MSLTDYVTNLRISYAKTLLAKTDVPIKSIAERCGIADIHYFTRLFKRICGMTPNAYRKSPDQTVSDE